MAEDSMGAGDADERLLRLVSEPIRLKAMTVLSERPVDARGIADELGIDVGEAARHLEEMRDEGLVEVVGEALRSGAVEPRYKAAVKLIWTDRDYELLGARGRRLLSSWLVGTIESDVKEALDDGYFDARPDAHTSRTICQVDEQGWTELNRILGDALDTIIRIREESAERLAERGKEGIPVLAAMISCELPRRGGDEA